MLWSNRKVALSFIMVIALLSSATSFSAERLRPFILAQELSGSELVSVIRSTKQHLTDAGFEIVGEYTPYAGSHVVIVSNSELLQLAKKERNASYMVGIRVGLAARNDKIQVSYNNLAYLKNAYQVKGDVSDIADALSEALGGNLRQFGSKRGLTARKLSGYHYSFGMEYFEDELELAEYQSHDDAKLAVKYNIDARKGGVYPVYEIKIPGTNRVVFGVGMTEGFSSDETIMNSIDFSDTSHISHLPYEILVDDEKVVALHPRFRIAIDFPDLKMVGSRSFYSIINSPGEIHKALALGVGGTWSENNNGGDDGFF